MARLVLRSEDGEERVFSLKLGSNLFGRSPKCDFRIEHATVSATHCELVLTAEGVSVLDRESTNGTFVDGRQVQTATLESGQVLRLGDVEIQVETVEITVAIPQFEVERPAPPVVTSDGSMICPRHPRAQVTHQCTYCREVLCDACVHRLRRRGGKVIKLCPLCSHGCEPIGGETSKKKGFLDLLMSKTVKLPFVHRTKK